MKEAAVWFLALVLFLSITVACAEEDIAVAEDPILIDEVSFGLNMPECGQMIAPEDRPDAYVANEEGVVLGTPCFFAAGCDMDEITPFSGRVTGGETYTVYLTLEAEPGYAFAENVSVSYFDTETYDDTAVEPLLRNHQKLVIVLALEAEHVWDEDQSERLEPTCVSAGYEKKVCSADPSHRDSKVLPVDPAAHQWGEWIVTREATRAAEGERVRSCLLCGKAETEVVGKVKLPYTQVYEPDTSWAMAATIAWRADAEAVAVAGKDIRPATAFVWLDSALNVYDREGVLLSDDLQSYIDQTVSGLIPAFYIRDAETAASLKAFLPDSGLLDCFVVSTPEHKELVKLVADLLHVRGMLDYTAVLEPTREELLDMIASTNGAHGKVILLGSEAATWENVRFLQKLASTVWVFTPTDPRAILTAYTNGVNGVLVDDYEAAIRAEELFRDDVPTLLRVPLIIGHRGDPSIYVENTLQSARGAYEEGVDSVENDIQLSRDGELFILHDDSPTRLLGITGVESAEELTIEELKAHPFLWEDEDVGIIATNEVPAAQSRYGKLDGQEEQAVHVIPTLREYIEAFQGTSLVHDTEIKSYDPAIIPAYKALVDAYDAWDQFFTITFNTAILPVMYSDYPEMSIGALCFAGPEEEGSPWASVGAIDEISQDQGPEAGLEQLYSVLDRWNATYNPFCMAYGDAAVRAGRHRGLTVWPWTYQAGLEAIFAKDYLAGVAGLTTDYAWVASDYIVEIRAEDAAAPDAGSLPKPQGITQVGASRTLADAEAVLLERLSDTQSLMIWRYRATLDWDGEALEQYYLYSNPFVMTVEE